MTEAKIDIIGGSGSPQFGIKGCPLQTNSGNVGEAGDGL